MNEQQPVIVCESLTRSYREGRSENTILKGVDLQIGAGEQVAILGASGSGKSTLLHLLGGLEKPSGGSVHLQGEPFTTLSANKRAALRNRHLGFIYQFHHLLPEFTALENVMLPLILLKYSRTQARQQAGAYLHAVGLSDRLKHYPATLSGGERQRVAVARALVNEPKCVLADEPTGNLDEQKAEQVYSLMCDLTRACGTSFVVVTHDTELAGRMDRMCHMHNGVVT